jgi:hypothetical protein
MEIIGAGRNNVGFSYSVGWHFGTYWKCIFVRKIYYFLPIYNLQFLHQKLKMYYLELVWNEGGMK